MSYFIQVKLCTGQLLEANVVEGSDPFERFATLGDLLFTGAKITPQELPDDAHAVQVTLAYEASDGQVTTVSSIFLLCEHDIVVTTQRSASKLYLPQGVTA